MINLSGESLPRLCATVAILSGQGVEQTGRFNKQLCGPRRRLLCRTIDARSMARRVFYSQGAKTIEFDSMHHIPGRQSVGQ